MFKKINMEPTVLIIVKPIQQSEILYLKVAK